MLKNLLILTLFLILTAQAQLFDSIGGGLKNTNLGGTLGTTTPSTTPTTASLLSYQVDPAITQQTISQTIESLKGVAQGTPEQIAQMETALRENLTRENMQLFIDQLFQGEGFKLDNMADVVAIYIIASFVVLNDLTNGTTTEQDIAVRNQIASAFATLPEVQNLSDAEKQTASESLLIFVMILANDWQQAQQGVEGYDLNTIKTYTKDTLVQMGIDPAQFDFTATGLVRKGTQTSAPQTTNPQPPGNTSANTANLTPEELEALPSCQQIVANPDMVKDIENGDAALQMCQEIVAKANATPTQTQQTPTQQTQPQQTANPLGETNPQNPLQAATDPFAATFNGQNIALTLTGNANYTGQLTFNGQTFPVQATSNGQTLTGTFTSNGTNFDFTATLQGTTLTLQSGGSTFTLEKAAANPLGN